MQVRVVWDNLKLEAGTGECDTSIGMFFNPLVFYSR